MSDQQPPPPPQQPPQPPAAGAAQPLTDDETRQWASWAHLGGILGFLPSLIIWLVYKDRSAFVAQESKTALNFQLTLLIGYVVITVASFLLPIYFVTWLIWIAGVVFSIIGFQTVQRGAAYKYPFSLDLIK